MVGEVEGKGRKNIKDKTNHEMTWVHLRSCVLCMHEGQWGCEESEWIGDDLISLDFFQSIYWYLYVLS